MKLLLPVIIQFLFKLFLRWMGGRIRPPFPSVSYEAAKRVSRWQRVYKRGTTLASCVTSTGTPAQNAANIPKPLVPNSHSPLSRMEQHAPFPLSQQSPLLPHLKFLHIPPSPLPSPSFPCTRVLGAIIIIMGRFRSRISLGAKFKCTIFLIIKYACFLFIRNL